VNARRTPGAAGTDTAPAADDTLARPGDAPAAAPASEPAPAPAELACPTAEPDGTDAADRSPVGSETAQAADTEAAGPVPATEAGRRETGPGEPGRAPVSRRVLGQLLLVAAFIAAGVAVTWPITPHLASGELLDVPDVSSYVWALWWMAHQVMHLANPWFTGYMAAPAGIQLGFDTLMPLPGLIMTPVTLLWGPVASFGVLTVVMPGLLCYGAYRAARLWLGQPGSIVAGGFFGLATMLAWQDLYHLNIALGTVFLPLTLEAAVRLRRSPARGPAVFLGLVLGGSVLTNQESAVVATLLAAAILVPWLVGRAVRRPDRAAVRRWLGPLALGAGVAIVVASPQLFAMYRQVADGGAAVKAIQLTKTYREYGVGLPAMLAPSPRLGHFHLGHLLGHLSAAYHYAEPTEGIPTFGIVLTAAALAGLALNWRRAWAWWLAVLWGAGALLALGPTLNIRGTTHIPLPTQWRGVTVSQLMPYTWLVRIPGLSALREADRLALLGLLGAALLAGAAVTWVGQHARPVITAAVIVVVAAAGFAEAGWSATGAATMRASLPTVDAAIAADHSRSVVLDVPFGLRGGVGLTGWPMPPSALVLATADGHPRSVSYTSWVPRPTVAGIRRYVFYRCLYRAENGSRHACRGAMLAKASHSAKMANIGWAIVWHKPARAARPSIIRYLYQTGFHKDYQVQNPDAGITVWRR
jgi:hypothetical protein